MILLASEKNGLPALPAPSRILEIGCGTGVLTERLADAFPSAKIDAVDISSAMTVEARSCLAGKKRINWIIEDARRLSEKTKYPLIVSNCALHWITPIEMIIAKLASLLGQGGRLAFAVMLRGTLAELNAARRRIAPARPPRVILPTRADLRRAINKAGLTIQVENSETIRQEYSSMEKMLRQLHNQGLTGGNIPGGKTLLTRSEIFRLIADYSRNYKGKSGVYASYRVFYCVAVKKAGAIKPIKACGRHSRFNRESRIRKDLKLDSRSAGMTQQTNNYVIYNNRILETVS
jgi:malonyl-CoA O-methyltransferase